MSTIVALPEPSPIDPMGFGSYAAPTMWDEDEWASPTLNRSVLVCLL